MVLKKRDIDKKKLDTEMNREKKREREQNKKSTLLWRNDEET